MSYFAHARTCVFNVCAGGWKVENECSKTERERGGQGEEEREQRKTVCPMVYNQLSRGMKALVLQKGILQH